MPKNVTLPDASLVHMPLRALEALAQKAPHVQTAAFRSTSANDTFTATDRPDLFVFDASSPQGYDTIVGFDPSEDLILILNPNAIFVLDPAAGVFYYEQDDQPHLSSAIDVGIDSGIIGETDSMKIIVPGDIIFW